MRCWMKTVIDECSPMKSSTLSISDARGIKSVNPKRMLKTLAQRKALRGSVSKRRTRSGGQVQHVELDNDYSEDEEDEGDDEDEGDEEDMNDEECAEHDVILRCDVSEDWKDPEESTAPKSVLRR